MLINDIKKSIKSRSAGLNIPLDWADDKKIPIGELVGKSGKIADCFITYTTQKIRDESGALKKDAGGRVMVKRREDGTPWLRRMVLLRFEGGVYTVTTSEKIADLAFAIADLDCLKPALNELVQVKKMSGFEVKVTTVSVSHGGRTWDVPDLEENDA